MPKSLNDRIDAALDSVNEATETLRTTYAIQTDLGKAAHTLRAAAEQLREAMEEVGELIDGVKEALETIDSEIENLHDLELPMRIKSLEVSYDAIELVSQMELEEEDS